MYYISVINDFCCPKVPSVAYEIYEVLFPFSERDLQATGGPRGRRHSGQNPLVVAVCQE